MCSQSKVDRKEAIRKYKERKPLLGAYAVRCGATGAVWVGASPNLEAARNLCWCALRAGGHLDKQLQQEWNSQDQSTFEFEIVETLVEDVPALSVRDLLKEKKQHWVKQLGARPLI